MSKRRQRSRQKRQGFTLMEILLVAAILVILASMATLAFRQLGQGATQKIARSEIDNFVNACEMFAITHQRFPNSLEELYQPQGMSEAQWGGPYMDRNKGDTIDPWGTEYQYQPDPEQDRVIVRSAGPDTQFGSDDDISNVNFQS